MNKKEIVKGIVDKLTKLNVIKDGCHNLNITLPNGNKLAWVGYTQVLISEKVEGVLFKNKRYPLYSKYVNADLLTLINTELSKYMK